MGLVDGGGVATLGYWQVVRPQAGTNRVTNPSFEKGATSWVGNSASLTPTVGAGCFGAYGGRMLATAFNGNVQYTDASVPSGTQVTGSAYVSSPSPLVLLVLTVGATVVSQAHPGDGQWHRLECGLVAPSTATPILRVHDQRTGSWTSIDIDGVVIELDTLIATDYMDGDQDGVVWVGSPHLSASVRDGRDGRTGRVVSTASVGLSILGSKGSGAPPMDISTLTLTLADGEVYQGTTSKSRSLTLQGLIVGDGTGLASWHAQRRGIIDLFTPDTRTNRGPITLRYLGASTTKRLKASYQGGLEMDALIGIIEKPEIKMFASDPTWVGELQQQVGLASAFNLTGYNQVAYRSPTGVWSNAGSGYTAGLIGGAADRINHAIQLTLGPDAGKILAVGTFSNIGGGSLPQIGLYDPNTNTWGSLGGLGGANQQVFCAAQLPTGDIIVGGDFTSIGGVAANRIARWNGSTWSAFGTGASSTVMAVVAEPTVPGTFYVHGSFVTINGTTVGGAAYWSGSAWIRMDTGLPGPPTVYSGPQGEVIGPSGVVTIARGGGIFTWNGSSWVSLTSVTPTESVANMLVKNGRLWVVGSMTAIGSTPVSKIAYYNGNTWVSPGGPIAAGLITGISSLPNGNILASGQGGWGSIGGVPVLDAMAEWHGTSWTGFQVDAPSTTTPANDQHGLWGFPDGSVLLNWRAGSGTFGTTLQTPGVTTLLNSGSSDGYPIIRFDGPGTINSIENQTTRQAIYLGALPVPAGVSVFVDLRPGKKQIVTSAGVSMASYIQATSDMSMRVAPGNNTMAIHAPGCSIVAYWFPRYWSAD